MPSPKVIFFAAGSLLATLSAADAHPGPKLLTQFGGLEQSDKTGGTSVESINGVHLYRGTRRLEGEKNVSGLAGGKQQYRKEIEIVIDIPFRRIRRLRTQGFYSGIAYPTRRYTQGFYSGR